MLNPTLGAELLEMRAADLRLRSELVRAGSLFDGYNERMADLHRRHNARLALVLAEYGWPGRTLAGEDGAEAAWLLLQHAILDPDLMRHAVPLLEQAVRTHDAEPRHLAFLVDRIRTLEGRPQLYGTSHDWDDAGAFSPLPIEEPAGDRRRAAASGGAGAARREYARAQGQRGSASDQRACRRRLARAVSACPASGGA